MNAKDMLARANRARTEKQQKDEELARKQLDVFYNQALAAANEGQTSIEFKECLNEVAREKLIKDGYGVCNYGENVATHWHVTWSDGLIRP